MSSRSNTTWRIIAAVAVFVISFASFSHRAASHHRVFLDEPGWISASLAAAGRVVHGDFTPSHWDDSDLVDWGDINPPAAKLLIGLPLVASYHGAPPVFHRLYALGLTEEANAAEGNLPPWPLLLRARIICCVISACVCVLVFVLMALVDGIAAGILAAAFLMMTTLFTYWSYHVVTDGAYMLSTVGIAIAALGYLRSGDERIGRRWLIAGALIVGFGASVKVTAALPDGLVLGAAIVRVALRGRDEIRWRRAAGDLARAAVAAFVLLLVINPSYWVDLHAVNIPAARAELALLPDVRREARANVAIKDGTVSALRRRCPDLYNLIRPAGYFLMPLRWRELTRAQAMESSVGAWKGPKVKEVTVNLLRNFQAFRKEFYVILLGLAILVASFWRAREQSRADGLYVLLAFVVAQYLLLVMIPLNFDRYYLSTVVGEQCLAAIAVVALARAALGLANGWSRSPKTVLGAERA